MSRVCIGFDPGATGAMAVIVDGQLDEVHDLPAKDGRTDAGALYDLLEPITRRHDNEWTMIVESVHAMPKQGVTSMFTFGYNLGVIHGVCGTFTDDLMTVTPQAWKKKLGLIGSDKQAARSLAIITWPDMAEHFRRKKDVGRADAALIAYYGWDATQ